MTCWRRLKEWNDAGVWNRLHHVLLDELHDSGQIDWSRAAVDSSARAGQRGGEQTGPSPVDRSRKASKHHVICAGNGIPLAATVTAANCHDVTQLLELVDRVVPVGAHGKFRPQALLADRAYDSRGHRAELRARGITPKIAKRHTDPGSGLGRERWVIERTFSWLHNHRRLARRYDRRADTHEAFLTIGCALICHQHLTHHANSF